MEIELLILKKKEIYSSLMEFIDTENTDIELSIENFTKHTIIKDKEEIISTLQLLSKISDNHRRLPDFIDKLGIIIQYLHQYIQSQISDIDIYKIFKNNKRVLLYLLEQKIIIPDESIISDIMASKDKNNFPYKNYLYSGIKSFINKKNIDLIEFEIKQNYDEDISIFEEKCRIGENDSYICSLIRQDLVEEFILYINRTNTSLMSQIQPSIYETNSYLMQKMPTLIEYASFFGSIQIIQYIRYSKVPLTSSLWFYAIHSNNAELIHFLEENEVKPQETNNGKQLYKQSQNESYEVYCELFKESIVCHHNAIADYIKDNFLYKTQLSDLSLFIISNCNYYYFPADIGRIICETKTEYGFDFSQLCFSQTQITIPSSVTSIGKFSFSRCSTIAQITIPSSVTLIKNYAFSECSSLKQVVFEIPSSVATIGNYAFNECSSLEQIEIPSSVTTIGDYAFYKCSSLEQVSIPSSMTSIRNYVFAVCTKLKQITIPSSVTSIGRSAFNKCTSLAQVTIPSSVKSIGNYAFCKCSSLTKIAILSSVKLIRDSTFSGCSKLTQIEIPSSVTSIGDSAFSGCSSLTEITIPSSVTLIGESAFSRCSSLAQTTIPSSVTLIRKDAFAGCKSLTQIEIPSSVTSIKKCAFSECSSLEQIIIPSSVTLIGDSAFKGCLSLTQISIPSSVTSIGKSVFNGVKTLAITGDIPKLFDDMFKECSSLTHVSIPSSVTSIGNYAFSGCTTLTQITIPSSVTSIGNYAFSGCTSLTQIEIPSSVTSIGANFINGCISLQPDVIHNIFHIKLECNKNSKDKLFKYNSSNENRRETKKIINSRNKSSESLSGIINSNDDDFDLISLSQPEIEVISKFFSQFKLQITHNSE